MIRKSTHPVDDVLSTYEEVMVDGEADHSTKTVKSYEGDDIKFSSHRLWTFYEFGVACCRCGRHGEFFAKEKNHDGEARYHLNLYAVDDSGEEVLMTKDHITPTSKGGADHISNYQTMCSPCNHDKGDEPV
jgi:5-methylcytosine-specific restriction endonuclease McrA